MISIKANRIPMSVTIAASFVALVVVLLGVVVWTSYESHRNSTVKLVAESAHQSMSFLRRELLGHLDPVVTQVNWVANVVTADGSVTTEQKRLGDILVGAIAATPQVTVLAFITNDGQVIRVYRGQTGTDWILDTQPPKNPAFAQRTLRRAKKHGTGFWNEILFSEGQQKSYINYVVPVRRGELFEGAVLAAVSLNELSDLVSEISSRMRGTAFILADENQVIAHPNLTSRHPEQSKESPTVQIGRVGDIVLGHFWSSRSHPIALEVGLEDFNIRQTSIGSQRYVFISGPVSGYGEKPWIVGGHLDAQTAEAPLQSVKRSLLFGVATILIGTIAATLLGHAISRPIREASSSISRIAELEIAHVQDLPGSQIAELDDQARAFNNMLRALRWFEMYVPRSLVSRLIQSGDQEVHSRQEQLTVLFTDLVGFTSATEKMSAIETAELLNHHFALLAACVEQEGGTVDKFIGDALMAFWGAPEPQPDGAQRAVRAACAMARVVHHDNLERATNGAPPIRMRIGLHSGLAVVGNIGAPDRMNYTVVGDTVNTAQRMEQLGKEIAPDAETVILATAAVVAEAGQQANCKNAGTMTAKGKATPINVFQVMVDPEDS